jgi:hypothetical protein
VENKVTIVPIALEPAMDTSEMLEYYVFVQSQVLEAKRMLDELLLE